MKNDKRKGGRHPAPRPRGVPHPQQWWQLTGLRAGSPEGEEGLPARRSLLRQDGWELDLKHDCSVLSEISVIDRLAPWLSGLWLIRDVMVETMVKESCSPVPTIAARKQREERAADRCSL